MRVNPQFEIWRRIENSFLPISRMRNEDGAIDNAERLPMLQIAFKITITA